MSIILHQVSGVPMPPPGKTHLYVNAAGILTLLNSDGSTSVADHGSIGIPGLADVSGTFGSGYTAHYNGTKFVPAAPPGGTGQLLFASLSDVSGVAVSGSVARWDGTKFVITTATRVSTQVNEVIFSQDVANGTSGYWDIPITFAYDRVDFYGRGRGQCGSTTASCSMIMNGDTNSAGNYSVGETLFGNSPNGANTDTYGWGNFQANSSISGLYTQFYGNIIGPRTSTFIKVWQNWAHFYDGAATPVSQGRRGGGAWKSTANVSGFLLYFGVANSGHWTSGSFIRVTGWRTYDQLVIA